MYIYIYYHSHCSFGPNLFIHLVSVSSFLSKFQYISLSVSLSQYIYIYIYIYITFNKFPDFFVKAFKIVVDS